MQLPVMQMPHCGDVDANFYHVVQMPPCEDADENFYHAMQMLISNL